MKNRFILWIGGLNLIVLSCTSDENISSSVTIIEKEIEVSFFDKIAIESALINQVSIKEAEEFRVSITGDSKIINAIEANISDARLQLNDKVIKVDSASEIKISISMPSISELMVTGLSDIEINGFLELSTIDHHGFGKLTLYDCQSKKLKLLNNEIGSFKGFGLEVDTLIVEQNGIGNIEVTVNKILEGELNGTGHILFKGNPDEIRVVDNGLGNVIDAN